MTGWKITTSFLMLLAAVNGLQAQEGTNTAAPANAMHYYQGLPDYQNTSPWYPASACSYLTENRTSAPYAVPTGVPYGTSYGAASADSGEAVADSSSSEEMPSWFERFRDRTCGEPRWTVIAQALWLYRSSSGCQTVLLDPRTSEPMFDAREINYPFAGGMEFGATCHKIWQDLDVEFNYFGLDSWGTQTYTFTGETPVGNLVVENNENTTLPVDSVTFFSHSQLYSGEVNVRQQCNSGLTFLGGFRWMQMFETYEASGILSGEETPFEHKIHSGNHLYGGQIGAQLDLLGSQGPYQFGNRVTMMDQGSPFRLSGYIKSGMFYNAVDQYSITPIGEANAKGSCATFLGEVGLSGIYQITSHVALRGGYRVLWMENLALAPRQITATDLADAANTSVDTGGALFCHGAHAGLEFVW